MKTINKAIALIIGFSFAVFSADAAENQMTYDPHTSKVLGKVYYSGETYDVTLSPPFELAGNLSVTEDNEYAATFTDKLRIPNLAVGNQLYDVTLEPTFIIDSATKQNARLIPDGSQHDWGDLYLPTIPPGYTYLVAWFQAATVDTDQFSTGSVSVVEYTLYRSQHEPVTVKYDQDDPRGLVCEQDGNYVDINCKGGIWERWFTNDNWHRPMPHTEISNGRLKIFLDDPLYVYHWFSDRAELNPGETYWVKVKFRVEGNVSFQLGFDYYRTNMNGWSGWDPTCLTSGNCEARVSRWYGATPGYIEITFPQ